MFCLKPLHRRLTVWRQRENFGCAKRTSGEFAAKITDRKFDAPQSVFMICTVLTFKNYYKRATVRKGSREKCDRFTRIDPDWGVTLGCSVYNRPGRVAMTISGH